MLKTQIDPIPIMESEEMSMMEMENFSVGPVCNEDIKEVKNMFLFSFLCDEEDER